MESICRALSFPSLYSSALGIALIIGILGSFNAPFSFANVVSPQAHFDAIQNDLILILEKAELPKSLIQIEPPNFTQESNSVQIECPSEGTLQMRVSASPQEWSSTLYWGLHKLGFLFPHPRVQISPTLQEIKTHCGESWNWKPRFAQRGFHLHTQHPNEWVNGFLQGDTEIANDMVRWAARNQQNLLQVVLLRSIPLPQLAHSLTPPFELAKTLGIATGISVSLEMVQQKSAHLAPPHFFSSIFYPQSTLDLKVKEISDAVENYISYLNFDFLSADMGTTEFSDSSFDTELRLIEAVRVSLEDHEKSLFVKVHASINQMDRKYGNFNFLPQYSHPSVGVLPHTLGFYGFDDENTPMYGRTHFLDMLEFMKTQVSIRPTWYFPETSYWVGMDQDIPLLLTDYLLARSRDMDIAQTHHVSGLLTFTSGQELGYWLFDWTVALLNSQDYAGDPLIGLKLLGECESTWNAEIAFQNKFFKRRGLISMLSSSNLMDELPWPLKHPVHQRKTLADLRNDSSALREEIQGLHAALKEVPSLDEIKKLLQVTHARIQHALAVRKALLEIQEPLLPPHSLIEASMIRHQAKEMMNNLTLNFNRYPTAHLFEKHASPTSYPYGYLWTAKSLHFWSREESMIKTQNFSPWFMNIYDPMQILF